MSVLASEWRERRATEVGVQHHAGGVDHRPQRGARGVGEPVPRAGSLRPRRLHPLQLGQQRVEVGLVRWSLDGLATPVEDGGVVSIVPAVAGLVLALVVAAIMIRVTRQDLAGAQP